MDEKGTEARKMLGATPNKDSVAYKNLTQKNFGQWVSMLQNMITSLLFILNLSYDVFLLALKNIFFLLSVRHFYSIE